jgi:hypothetical protein
MTELSARQETILRVEAITGDNDAQHPQGAWGELEEDYPPQPQQTDVKCLTFEEVETIYDQSRPEDITINPLT